MRITVCCKNLYDAVADLDDGHIKGTAAQIVYHDLLFLFVVKTICQCRRRRLVNNTLYLQTGNFACVFCSLTLSVIEICGNRNDCFSHLLPQITLCICLQLLQNHCGNLLRGIFLAVNRTSVIRTHVSLNRSNGFLSIGNCLTLCRLAYQPLSGLCKCHYGRCGPCAFCIGYNGGFSTFHHCNTAVCRT